MHNATRARAEETDLHVGPNFAIQPDPKKSITRPEPVICAALGPDPTRPAGLTIKRKNHKTPSREYLVAF